MGWTPLLLVAVAFAVSAVGSFLAAAVLLPPVARARDAHWTERARQGAPARIASRLLLVLMPALVGALAAWRAGDWTAVPAPLVAAACALAAFAPTVALGAAIETRVRATAIGLRRYAAGLLILALVLASVFVAVPLTLLAVFTWPGHGGLVFAAGAAVVTIGAMGGSLAVGRRTGLLGSPSARLQAAVAAAAARVGRPAPGVDEIGTRGALAAAVPLAQRLVFTRGIVETLDDAELAAIAAHELGHLAEPRVVGLMRLLPSLGVIGVVAGLPDALHGSPLPIAAALVGTLATASGAVAVARRMEKRADTVACGANDGPVFARALERVYATYLIPAVAGRRGVHPDLPARMRAAGVEPGWPIPQGPPRLRAVAAYLLALVPLLLVSLLS